MDIISKQIKDLREMPIGVKEKMTSDAPPSFRVIEDRNTLTDLARKWMDVTEIAVDLEADSMFHYQERVCLLQMATADENVIIDPLAVEDLSCLKPLFAAPGIRKIFHGADYDVRSLNRDFGIEIRNLFDTQLASRFLGMKETSLEAVIRDHFNVLLDKKYQKKNWSERPLSNEMLTYAARDTAYLIPLSRILETRLKTAGRWDWVTEECDLLTGVRAVNNNEEPLFLRFKGAGRLRGRSLAVLESVLKLRKEIAEKKDRPVFKVFGNETISRIVKSKPSTLKRLEKSNALSRKQLNMYGQQIVASVAAGMEVPEEALPVYPRKKAPRLGPRVPERIGALKKWRQETGDRLDIDPALILGKSLMGDIARKNPKQVTELHEIEDMREWQRREFGAAILNVLASVEPEKPKRARKRRRRKKTDGNADTV